MRVDANALLNGLPPRSWESEALAQRNGLALVSPARARRLKSGLVSVSLVWRSPHSVMTILQTIWVSRGQVRLVRKRKSSAKRGR